MVFVARSVRPSRSMSLPRQPQISTAGSPMSAAASSRRATWASPFPYSWNSNSMFADSSCLGVGSSGCRDGRLLCELPGVRRFSYARHSHGNVRTQGPPPSARPHLYHASSIWPVHESNPLWLCSRRRAAFRQQFGRHVPHRMFMRTDSSSLATGGMPSAAPREPGTKALATGADRSKLRAAADCGRVPPVLVNIAPAGRRAPPGVVNKRCRKS